GRGSSQAVAGAVYTASNATTGNEVLIFNRRADGQLEPGGVVGTGGLGTGAGLGNQGALALSDQGRWLLAVNAASDTVSVLRIHNRGLDLIDVEPSGGVGPVSVTSHRNIVYVLNAASDSIAGFRLGPRGQLEPIDDSTRALSGSGGGAAQVAFSPRGDVLVVTEKATNRIVTFLVDDDGRPGFAQVHDSVGQTPFGFSFGKRDQVFVAEAFGGAPDASATTSYEVGREGSLTPISPSVGTNQTANCWVVVTPDGRFAYVTNTGSGSISGYQIAFDGEIALLDLDGRTGVTGDGSGPIDLALSANGRYLYSLHSGTQSIGVFEINDDGALTPLPFTAGLPAGANGLVAR
ncbi:MAG TPA: beta-propeller fold lactonase family protein, partial [Vicinamibacterales bacterium]|nr:beta-propeller fold lactonase family protein [Vicinamibacterales bacterium]